MTALTAGAAPVLARLSPKAAFHSTWGEIVSWCGPRVDTGHDPFTLHPFAALGAGALPPLLGPVVYSALGRDGRCYYVGQSTNVRDRFRGHACVPGRQGRWEWILLCALRDDIIHGTLDKAERIASKICRPLEGERHPRRR